jgi:hypothetical protein
MSNSQYNNVPMTYSEVSEVQSTEGYFSNLYNFKFDLATNVNDAVQTYFQEVTGEVESAKILAASVILTASARGTDPMALIQQFRAMPKGELNLYLATFLNLNRVSTSLLGVKNQPRTNYFVQRSILA